MKKAIFACGILLLAACYHPTATTTQNTATADTLIQRIVCFKFKSSATAAEIRQHMRGFQGLKDSIPQIISYHTGPTVSGDLPNAGEYDVMHFATYRSEEAIREYAVHPVHQRFIQQNRAIWEKVLVMNARIRP